MLGWGGRCRIRKEVEVDEGTDTLFNTWFGRVPPIVPLTRRGEGEMIKTVLLERGRETHVSASSIGSKSHSVRPHVRSNERRHLCVGHMQMSEKHPDCTVEESKAVVHTHRTKLHLTPSPHCERGGRKEIRSIVRNATR